MNALSLVPAFRRQVNVYTQGANTTDSALAGYIADSVQALMALWDRSYDVDFISPATYTINPDIESRDIRPIVLMASIIYKMGNVGLVNFTDGDFSWNPHKGLGASTIEFDKQELLKYAPLRLAGARAGQFYGFGAVYNPENYSWWNAVNYVYF